MPKCLVMQQCSTMESDRFGEWFSFTFLNVILTDLYVFIQKKKKSLKLLIKLPFLYLHKLKVYLQ